MTLKFLHLTLKTTQIKGRRMINKHISSTMTYLLNKRRDFSTKDLDEPSVNEDGGREGRRTTAFPEQGTVATSFPFSTLGSI
jgi:hypothetical protein